MFLLHLFCPFLPFFIRLSSFFFAAISCLCSFFLFFFFHFLLFFFSSAIFFSSSKFLSLTCFFCIVPAGSGEFCALEKYPSIDFWEYFFLPFHSLNFKWKLFLLCNSWQFQQLQDKWHFFHSGTKHFPAGKCVCKKMALYSLPETCLSFLCPSRQKSFFPKKTNLYFLSSKHNVENKTSVKQILFFYFVARYVSQEVWWFYSCRVVLFFVSYFLFFVVVE